MLVVSLFRRPIIFLLFSLNLPPLGEVRVSGPSLRFGLNFNVGPSSYNAT
uniref:Uncharacterized protein n=1 Tax=Rhizophora mucronata TaxID=61149 RepID=A0A2P2KBE5_RHIMU